MNEYLLSRLVKLYTKKCDGMCGDSSLHNSHLTKIGKRHYLGVPKSKSRFRIHVGPFLVRVPARVWAMFPSRQEGAR
jgi:hypothetical protein